MKIKDLMPKHLSETAAKRVAGAVRYAGFGDTVSPKDIPLVKAVIAKAVKHHKEVTARFNPLKSAAVSAESDCMSSCPFCGQQMSDITLLGDRPAVYCEVHSVVYPKPQD